MLVRLVTRRGELERGEHHFSPPFAEATTPSIPTSDPIPPNPVTTRTHDMNGNLLSQQGYPVMGTKEYK
jgi:hypothetical protein